MLVALQLFVQLPRESECCLLDDDSTRRRCTGQTYLAAVTASHSSTSSGGSNGANSDIVNSRVAFLNPSHRRTHIRRILQRGTAVVNTHTTTPLPLLSRRGCGLLHKRAATSSSTALSMASKTKTGKTGARLIANNDEYAEHVLDSELERPVLVFFTAPWCGPCRLSIPVVKEIMKQFSNRIGAVEVCTDDLPDVAAESNVVSIPTIQMYYRGKLVDTIVGCVAKTVLSSTVEKILEDASAQLDPPGGSDGSSNSGNDDDATNEDG